MEDCCWYDADWCAHRRFCCCQHRVFVSNVCLFSAFCCVCVCVCVCVPVRMLYHVWEWSPGVAEEVRPLACSHHVRAALLRDGWRRLAPSTFSMANSKYREQVSEKTKNKKNIVSFWWKKRLCLGKLVSFYTETSHVALQHVQSVIPHGL